MKEVQSVTGWMNIQSVKITSRGVSGFTADRKYYVIVFCVDMEYDGELGKPEESNVLLVVDVTDKELLSWHEFESKQKCVGQISATNHNQLIVPLGSGTEVVALS